MKQIDQTCSVWPLAQRYNKLAYRFSRDDLGNEEVAQVMEELVEAASHLTPRCVLGAAFQISAASAEIDRTSDADPQAVREASQQQGQRLLYRAASFLYGTSDELCHARDYLMPVPFDPARNLFGHMAAAAD